MNESRATHHYRLTKLEKSPEPEPSPEPEQKPDTGELDQRRFLPYVIADKFNLSDLRVLAHELNGDYENLEGETKVERALSLVLWMQRNGRFSELLSVLAVHRPREDWDRFG